MFKSIQPFPAATRVIFATAFLVTTTAVTFNAHADAPIAPIAQPKLERVASEVDAAALVLGEPTRGKMLYNQAINGLAFQDPIISHAGWQYVVYYDAARKVCLARRKLPTSTASAGSWQTIRFSGYEFGTNDAHNTASVGICAQDGTIHVIYDGHGPPTYIRSSRPGVAKSPETVLWDEGLFSSQRNDVELGKPLKSISYPRFISTPDGGLQMTYRVGGSGNGDLWMVEYNAAKGSWEKTRQVDSGKGNWSEKPGGPVYKTRNSYPNGFQYGSDGKLHMSWLWSEVGVGNRDIAYAYSEDRGISWKNSAGTVIAQTMGDANGKVSVINVDSPGLIIAKVPIGYGLINTQGQAVDNEGRIHIMMSHTTPESARSVGLPWPSSTRFGAVAALRYHHYMRESDGTWKHFELPWVAGGRGWMGFDEKDNAYFVYMGRTGPIPIEDKSGIYFAGSITVATATAKANYQDWNVAYVEQGPFSSEFRLDDARLKKEGVLSMMTQRWARGGVYSSQLSVVDLKLNSS